MRLKETSLLWFLHKTSEGKTGSREERRGIKRKNEIWFDERFTRKAFFSLSLVCLSFHRLAAVHIFESISSDQVLNPFSRPVILPDYGSLIKTFTLCHPSPAINEDWISRARNFPNLSRLIIYTLSLKVTFPRRFGNRGDEGLVSDEDETSYYQSFTDLARKIKHLHIQVSYAWNQIPNDFLPLFPNISHLALGEQIGVYAPSFKMSSLFFTELCQLPSLRNLSSPL